MTENVSCVMYSSHMGKHWEIMQSIQYFSVSAWEPGVIVSGAIFLMEYVICICLHFGLVSYCGCLSSSSFGFGFICATNGKISDKTPCKIDYIYVVHVHLHRAQSPSSWTNEVQIIIIIMGQVNKKKEREREFFMW